MTMIHANTENPCDSRRDARDGGPDISNTAGVRATYRALLAFLHGGEIEGGKSLASVDLDLALHYPGFHGDTKFDGRFFGLRSSKLHDATGEAIRKGYLALAWVPTPRTQPQVPVRSAHLLTPLGLLAVHDMLDRRPLASGLPLSEADQARMVGRVLSYATLQPRYNVGTALLQVELAEARGLVDLVPSEPRPPRSAIVKPVDDLLERIKEFYCSQGQARGVSGIPGEPEGARADVVEFQYQMAETWLQKKYNYTMVTTSDVTRELDELTGVSAESYADEIVRRFRLASVTPRVSDGPCLEEIFERWPGAAEMWYEAVTSRLTGLRNDLRQDQGNSRLQLQYGQISRVLWALGTLDSANLRPRAKLSYVDRDDGTATLQESIEILDGAKSRLAAVVSGGEFNYGTHLHAEEPPEFLKIGMAISTGRLEDFAPALC